MSPDVITPEAQFLHERSIVIDGHADTLIENFVRPVTPNFSQLTDQLHMDLDRALAGGLTCAMFMVGGNRQPLTWQLVDLMYREIEASAGRMRLALCAEDIRQANADGQLACLMSFEGGLALGGDLAILRHFYRLGVRCMSITHGEDVVEGCLQGEKSVFGFCDSAARKRVQQSGRGLTAFGRAAVKEMNALGVLIDVAHCNDRSFWDVIDLSESPPLCTHGNCFALSPHSRNLTDEQLQALGQCGGVVGLAFYPPFIHQTEPSLDGFLDHVEHVVETAGVQAAGIGSDFDGMGKAEPIVPDVSRLPMLTHAMLDRGFAPADVEKILGGNFLRVIAKVVG